MVFYESPKGSVRVELGNRYMAALYAWLLPGAGHFYQKRYTKGLLFSITILTIYFVGFWLGDGRVVYASFEKNDFRWQYFGQAFVGTPTFPAVLQAVRRSQKMDPLWIRCYRYPADGFDPDDRAVESVTSSEEKKLPAFSRLVDDAHLKRLGNRALPDGFMAAPAGVVTLNSPDVLSAWHAELGHYFDIGTLYTFVAGLLNLLVIYDAFAGPAIFAEGEDDEELDDKERNDGNPGKEG